MSEPLTCLQCSSRQCEEAEESKLNICYYGISFYRSNSGEIQKQEPRVSLKEISTNLRHELNKFLQMITNEVKELDPSISTKRIKTDSPHSRIVAATVIIDNFIKMIAGVYDFSPGGKHIAYKTINLHLTIENAINTYSLVKNTRRSKSVSFSIECDPSIKYIQMHNFVKYCISALVDNAFKYSLDSSNIKVEAIRKVNTRTGKKDLVDVAITNHSKPISNANEIFEKGQQADKESEGFGLGLYWVKMLAHHYNEEQEFADGVGPIEGETMADSMNQEDLMYVEHEQEDLGDETALQTFTLRNVRCEEA